MKGYYLIILSIHLISTTRNTADFGLGAIVIFEQLLAFCLTSHWKTASSITYSYSYSRTCRRRFVSYVSCLPASLAFMPVAATVFHVHAPSRFRAILSGTPSDKILLIDYHGPPSTLCSGRRLGRVIPKVSYVAHFSFHSLAAFSRQTNSGTIILSALITIHASIYEHTPRARISAFPFLGITSSLVPACGDSVAERGNYYISPEFQNLLWGASESRLFGL